MQNLLDKLTVLGFGLLLAFLAVCTLLGEKQEISIFENRALAEAPEFSGAELVSGAYFADWESYLQDHFHGRDGWLRAHVFYETRLLGRRVVNDVVLLDDLLLPRISYVTPVKDLEEKAYSMAQSLARIDDVLAAWDGHFLFVGIPEQYSALRDRYPGYIFNNEQNLSDVEREFFARLADCEVDYLNMRALFAEAGGLAEYYLKTDHHFNYAGAYLTYSSVCARLRQLGYDLPVYGEAELNFIELPQYFLGSRGRKLYRDLTVTEQLVIYELAEPLSFTRYDGGALAPSSVFTLPEDPTADIDYTIYMGGDISETVIKTDRPTLPNLLIFGDSFTNPLETLLYLSFNETRSLDLRIYSEMTLLEYIALYQPDVVICVRDDNYYLIQEGNGLIE